MIRLVLVLLLFANWPSVLTVRAQTPEPPDVNVLGPQVGDRVPEFSAIDQNGEEHTLASILGDAGAMVVFFRSADW